jgi:hypothetical protein
MKTMIFLKTDKKGVETSKLSNDTKKVYKNFRETIPFIEASLYLAKSSLRFAKIPVLCPPPIHFQQRQNTLLAMTRTKCDGKGPDPVQYPC